MLAMYIIVLFTQFVFDIIFITNIVYFRFLNLLNKNLSSQQLPLAHHSKHNGTVQRPRPGGSEGDAPSKETGEGAGRAGTEEEEIG